MWMNETMIKVKDSQRRSTYKVVRRIEAGQAVKANWPDQLEYHTFNEGGYLVEDEERVNYMVPDSTVLYYEVVR